MIKYILSNLLFHGKQLFDKLVNNPTLIAQTVLGIMLIWLNEGSKSHTR